MLAGGGSWEDFRERRVRVLRVEAVLDATSMALSGLRPRATSFVPSDPSSPTSPPLGVPPAEAERNRCALEGGLSSRASSSERGSRLRTREGRSSADAEVEVLEGGRESAGEVLGRRWGAGRRVGGAVREGRDADAASASPDESGKAALRGRKDDSPGGGSAIMLACLPFRGTRGEAGGRESREGG